MGSLVALAATNLAPFAKGAADIELLVAMEIVPLSASGRRQRRLCRPLSAVFGAHICV